MPQRSTTARARRIALAVAGVLALQLGLVATYRARPRTAPASSTFRVAALDGTEGAPELSFARPDGALTPIASLRGRVVLVHFWATWCAPCLRELPSLRALARSLDHHAHFALLLVAERDTLPALERFFRGPIPREVVLDPLGAQARRFGVTTLPDTFVISPQGRLVGRAQGSRDWSSADARAFLTETLRRAR